MNVNSPLRGEPGTVLLADLTDPTGGPGSQLLTAFIAGVVLVVVAVVVARMIKAAQKEGNEGAKDAGLELWKLAVIAACIGAAIAVAGFAFGKLAGLF